ncbi:MAG: choice-of-anchor V domain-containing protein [Pyrinomonadaceae bacterium]
MVLKIKNIKLAVLMLFILGFAVAVANSTYYRAEASTGGAPAARTGAPGESTCTSCHNAGTNTGVFSIAAPLGYVPGQTYTIQVQHATTDASRGAWGFELIPLTSGNAMAGTVANLNTNTRVRVSGAKSYIEQSSAGAFLGQTLTANWSFSWTAPATNVGNVTFYAAGLQGDNSGDESGDHTYVRSVVVPAVTTAAVVAISGRAMTPEGRGLRNALVVIAGENGTIQTAITTAYGYYRFAEVPSGSTYVINVRSRRYRFDAQIVQAFDDLTSIDFVGHAPTDKR